MAPWNGPNKPSSEMYGLRNKMASKCAENRAIYSGVFIGREQETRKCLVRFRATVFSRDDAQTLQYTSAAA